MRRQRRPCLALDKKAISVRTYQPRLEEIETRLLPGETVGLSLPASFGLFGDLLPALLGSDETWSAPTGLARSTEAVGSTKAELVVLARDSGKSNRVILSTSQDKQTDYPRPSARDARCAANGLTENLGTDLSGAATLFAAARPSGQPAAAVADVFGNHRSAAADFAVALLAGSSLYTVPGAVQAGVAARLASLVNPGSASAALAGSGVLLGPGHISTADQGGPSWSSYAHDPQHTAISDVPAQPLTGIRWQTPVDLNPQYHDGELLIHYGSPLVTQANTVIVPVKTGPDDGFEVEAFDGGTGALKWSVSTDYSVPTSHWTPPMSPVLTPGNRLYIPGAGGTVYYMDDPDANNAMITGQLAFYGISNYDHSYDDNVKISTPLTSDSLGNIYFGFTVYGPTPLDLQSGIARMNPKGNGSWAAASTAAGDTGISEVTFNCVPALSNDQSSLYIAVSTGGGGAGYLLRLDSTTLTTTGKVFLVDPASGQAALLPNAGTASPTVGPDGDVYFGVLENPFPSNNDRGWLLHFSGDLTQAKLPGAFGWDDTASIVPATMVPSYTGSSSYLLMTKYNNYKGIGTGDGVNKLAVLDPNAMMVDPITGACVMQEVLTIAGVTPDPALPSVREWCINSAAVDPSTMSILANSEDGTLYRWDLVTNSFTQAVNLTSPTGEAYTPTVIGVDGTVYAINNATLFAVM